MYGLCWQGKTFKPPQASRRTQPGVHTDVATAPTAILVKPTATRPSPVPTTTARPEAPPAQAHKDERQASSRSCICTTLWASIPSCQARAPTRPAQPWHRRASSAVAG